jgi:hypothetical protein
MTDGAIIKAQKIMLSLAIFFMPFVALPKRFMLSAIGGHLSYYPIFLGILLWFYEILKKGEIDINKKFIRYFSIYILWQIICTIIGLITYKYYNLIDLSQMDKLRVILDWTCRHNIYIEDGCAIKLWLGIRFIKDIVKDNFFYLGVSLWICHLYKNNWRGAFSDIKKVVVLLVICMCCYSVVEIGFLRGNVWATNFLIKINPFIYDLQSSHGWWPPVLWWGQLRSLFPEPSFFGIVAAMILPFLFSSIYEIRKPFNIILYILYCIMLFATKARTATLLYIGEMLLLVGNTFLYFRKYWRKTVGILLYGIIAFFMTIVSVDTGIISDIVVPKVNSAQTLNAKIAQNKINAEVNSYVRQNVTSAVGNKRSNKARMANLVATAKVGVQHPIFGIGYKLSDAYIDESLPEWSYDNDEVRNWSRYMHIEGVLKSGFPNLNEYVAIFAEYGIIGLCLFVMPILYVLKYLLHKRDLANNITLNCALIGFVGAFMAMIINGKFLTFYILLGLLLCYIEEEQIDRKA